jgi:hypothetical protein
MTEYESWEVLNGLVANLMQQQALFVGAFTAYVIAAHLVGRTLTTFQVSFVSAVFILLAVLGIQSQLWFISNIDEISKGVGGIVRTDDSGGWLISGGFILVRVILIVGALFYMWQMRHPKEE